MTEDNFIKSTLALFCFRETPLTGGAEEMTAIAMAIRNRVRAGIEGGSWLSVLEGAEARRAAASDKAPRSGFPDLRDPHWRKFFSRIDSIFDGTLADTWTSSSRNTPPGMIPLDEMRAVKGDRSGLYWADLQHVDSVWFMTNIIRDPSNHPKSSSTPELQSDSVARRELRTRLTFAERQLEFEIARLFSPSAVTQTCWFQAGIQRSIPSARLLSRMISDICDQVYSSTPIIRNELLNRRHLSSAAAAARRNLIEAMLKHSSEMQLGIEGYPPELSMYVSVLKASGMHRAAENNGFDLGPPSADSSLFPVWSRIERFFADSELQRQTVTVLYDILADKPFGLKQGVIPVLFCASLLCHDTDVALYEEGAFVPEITADVFERLLKHPKEFEVRSYRVSGVRKQVFEQYAAVFDAQNAPNLVAVVRPLFRFFNRLPDYSKRTSTVSTTAIAVKGQRLYQILGAALEDQDENNEEPCLICQL